MTEEVKKKKGKIFSVTEEKKEALNDSESEIVSAEKIAEKKEDDSVQAKKRKKIKRQVQRGQAHIQCTYNNTLIGMSDINGSILGWSSSGSMGFKGAKKSTPYAATQVVGDLAEKVRKYGLTELDVFVKGVGSGREASIRAFINKGFNILSIKDITPIPHNGCKRRKARRV